MEGRTEGCDRYGDDGAARSPAALHGAVALLLLGTGLGAPGPAAAQHEGHAMDSSYAATGSDTVQTLTADEVAALLEGAGMGLARPAEMNGYPGPRHVLDLADSLALTPEQAEQVQAIFRAMHHRAVELGREIIDAEKRLDAAFAGDADAPALQAQVTALARLRGELRWTHLRAHLETVEVLTAHQRHSYDRLRGYGSHPH
ncbi:MAG: periplasmic heavy metal sensor [Longimicrobiales bacterium]